MKKPNKGVRINVRLTKEERKQFKQYCAELDVVMSERIRELIQNDLEGKYA
jgi:hypothetical protein